MADLLARDAADRNTGRGRPSALAWVGAVLAVDSGWRSGRRALPGRERTAELADAFAQERDGEIMLYGLHIAEYGFGTWTNHQPRRTRKLLPRRMEIDKILDKVREGGLTLVPLSMYFETAGQRSNSASLAAENPTTSGRFWRNGTPTAESPGRWGRHLKGMPRQRN